jgi:hypothetical protein
MRSRPIAFLRRRFIARYQPSALLLAAQFMSLLLYALAEDIPGGRALLGAFTGVILALAVWVVSRSPAIRWIAWALALPAFVLSLWSALVPDRTLLIWSALFEASLYFYSAGGLIAYMMEDHRVTTDELFAAGATFTLLAWGFAYVYLVCQTLVPGSFPGAINPGEPRTFVELLFLSFTILSGTGLGDILPMTSPARVLVMIEQFAGVAYLAVVVSRLIGMTIVNRRERQRLIARAKASGGGEKAPEATESGRLTAREAAKTR